MAVTVTDQRTIISECDATTGWTGSNTVTLFTADPAGVESTGCLGMVVSNATQNAYFTLGASINTTGGHLIYAWIFHRAQLDTRANGGLMVQLGDGTNRIGFHVGGSDIDGFRHSEGPVGWQCVVLDTAALPTARTVFAGSYANLNLAAITQIGVAFKTTVKAVGGVENCFWDILRYATPGQGLLVSGGTSGDPGTWEQLATADRDTANQKAHGIVRKLGAGVFGVQGWLKFGDNVGTSATWFEDTNVTVVFEDRGVYPDKYGIEIVGNSTGNNTFRLGTASGSGDSKTGINGCTILAPSAAPAQFIASDGNVDECSLYGCQLVGFAEGVTLSSNATTGPSHNYCGTTFRNCAEVDVGRTFVRNCVFTATKHFRQDVVTAFQDDGGVFTTFTTAINNDTTNDVDITPATPVANDAFYIGHTAKFNDLRMLVSTAGTTTYAVEYYNGSTWTAVSGLTDTSSGLSKIQRARMTFPMPSNWATTTVNSVSGFWLRLRVSTAGTRSRVTRIKLFGPPDGSALLWNANIDIKRCSFTSNTDSSNDPHAIEHPASGSFTYYGMTFSSNDYDIEYTASSGNLTISASEGSNPGTYEVTNGGGTVTINNTINLIIEIRDSDGTLITDACEVTVVKSSDTTELYHVESVTTGSTTYSYSYVSDTTVYINVVNVSNYVPKTVEPVVLSSVNQTVVVQLESERGRYSNP